MQHSGIHLPELGSHHNIDRLQLARVNYQSRQKAKNTTGVSYYYSVGVCIQLVRHRSESPSIKYQFYNAASSELNITIGVVFGLGNRLVQHLLSPRIFWLISRMEWVSPSQEHYPITS